jgi:hypothetical protein
VALVAADQAMSALLKAADVSFPSSVACIVVLGVAAATPQVGTVLQLALGPGAAWLRAGLPLFLCPPILVPLALELPPADYLGKMVALAAATSLVTMGAVGHLAHALMPGGVSGKLKPIADPTTAKGEPTPHTFMNSCTSMLS